MLLDSRSIGIGILEKSGFFLKKAAVTYVAKNRTLAFVSSASWVAKIIVMKFSLCRELKLLLFVTV